VLVSGARGNRILRVSSSGNTYFGFVVADSSGGLIRGSSGSANPAPEGDGLGVFASHDLRILGNTFRRNGLGMHVEESTDVVVRRNRFAGNRDFGILMEADRNVVRDNRTTGNGTGIGVAPGNRNLITGNRSLRDDEGIAVEKGRGNVVARNLVVATRYSGIRVGVARPPIGSLGTLVRGNVVEAAGRNGFEVNRRDRHSRLVGNLARGAHDDGFDLASRSVKLANNRANRNADLGIEAVPGVIDAGGNRARDNGDVRQCTVVWCW
jgi:parallel beta-helix repeat protein